MLKRNSWSCSPQDFVHTSSGRTHTGHDKRSPSNGPYVPCKVRPVTSSQRLEQAAEGELDWRKGPSFLSLRLTHCSLKKGRKKKKTTCDGVFWGVSTSRLYPVGCHSFFSLYLCPAQVGGGGAALAFSLSCFLLQGNLWRGLMWQSPSQIIRAQTEGGGVQAFTPASRDLGKSVSKEGGRASDVYRSIDRWWMWNGIKREDCRPSGGSHSGVCGWVAQFFFNGFVIVFLISSFKLLVFVISSSVHFFFSPFWAFVPLFSLPFFCARGGGAVAFSSDHPAEVASTGIKSALLNFADGSLWTQQLLPFSSAATFSNYCHHRPHCYHHHHHHHYSSFDHPICRSSKTFGKSVHSHFFFSVTNWFWVELFSDS